jgi:hypothetical protein
MWNCPDCHEDVPDSFEICWSCGTSKSGERDPNFGHEIGPSASDGRSASPEPARPITFTSVCFDVAQTITAILAVVAVPAFFVLLLQGRIADAFLAAVAFCLDVALFITFSKVRKLP